MSRGKPKTRLQNWTKKVVLSFKGEPFTKADVSREWNNHASARSKPTDTEINGLLKNLVAQGIIERYHESERVTAKDGGTYEMAVWREVD